MLPQGYRSSTPIQTSRTRRRDAARGVTTGKAGKFIPLRYIPLFREDSMVNARVGVTIEMAETVRPLVNAVYANVMAIFVPFAAFDRFQGLDDYNRAYTKNPAPGESVSFIQAAAFAANEVYDKLGIHMVAGAQHNTAVLEAYNEAINLLRVNRSPNLTKRTALDGTLAPCFWLGSRFSQVVPNYDRALIDAIVPLTGGSEVPVRGLGIRDSATGSTSTYGIRESGSAAPRTGVVGWVDGSGVAGSAQLVIEQGATAGYPNLRVDLGTSNLSVRLSDLDLARKTAAFEALRQRFSGHDDDSIVELLMEGIRVPEFMEREPLVLADRVVKFDFATRFAADGANLDQSVTNGFASVSMSLSMPRTNVGGVVVILASCTPDQLFERKKDHFLAITDQDSWPKYERDSLDTEQVDPVLCSDIDVAHATPGAIFGYEPMNERWNRDYVNLGGDLLRRTAGATFDEDRAVLWVTEPLNPTLTADWYLATNVNAEPFADRVKDHLVFTVVHDATIEGNTVFGPPLLEVPAV